MAIGKKITEKQKGFFGAECGRAKEGKSTKTGMSEHEVCKVAKKPIKKK